MWAQLIDAALGLWLLAAPAVLAYGDPARANDRVVGPIVVAVGLIAAWAIARPLRWVNTVAGLWLVVSPFVLRYGGVALVNSVVVGVLVCGLALIQGQRQLEHFGGGWRAIWREEGERH